MADSLHEIKLSLSLDSGATDDELFEETHQLYTILLNGTDSKTVEKPTAEQKPGSKSGTAITFGVVLLTLTAAALPTVIEVTYDWIKRRTIKESSVTLQLKDGTSVTVPASSNMTEAELKDMIGMLSNQLKKISDSPRS